MKEFRDLLAKEYDDANVVVLGVPFDCNCSISSGASFAPQKLRELSWWLPAYSMDGKPLSHIRIYDRGDLTINSFDDICKSSDIFGDDKLKVIFGGDHSISIPFQKQFIDYSKKNNKTPILIHIDAHCDICDEYLGSKYSHACTVRRALDNGIKEENLYMIGIREFEKDGFDYLINRGNKVNLFKASDVFEQGINNIVDNIFNTINDDKYSVYISFDIDSLDSAYAPGTGTPETCGLTPLMIKTIFNKLGMLKNIYCFDIVEVSPPLDVNDITSWAAIKLFYEFLVNYNKQTFVE